MITSNLYLDPACLGSNAQLVDVTPDYYGASREKQSEPVGYRYEVMLPAHKFDKLVIKVPGKQLVDTPISGNETPVEFDGLIVRPYVNGTTGRLALTATATGIRVAKGPSGNTATPQPKS